MRTWVLRLLRVPCGAFGGELPDTGEGRFNARRQRWCLKRFGHSDSHAYDFTEIQPLHRERRRAQGWKD